ncbi:MAG: helix-turn-helix domain-containing protein [Actinomycetota bacterium]|nr:helix-turn-helix domain-containing protein [Actinomycetota bacterium]
MTTPSLGLSAEVTAALAALLPDVAQNTVAAVIEEVPGYSGALHGPMGETITQAVQMALKGFLTLAERGQGTGSGTPHRATLDGAYALGRGEARTGRSMDALLAAYRVGARVAWREWSTAAAASGMPAETLARFAELVFAYIDQLSAASAAGHTDELATTGRVRERYLQQLAEQLLAAAPDEALQAAAERADWSPSETLTAVLLPQAQVRGLLSAVDPRSLSLPDAGESAVVLVADAVRSQLLGSVQGVQAVVGPARPWTLAGSSYRLALRAQALGAAGVVDAEEHLPELVLTADPEALEDLRRRVLAPLADLRPAAREKLAETLRSWLLHHGRREAVAADLFVHPQTVRYRLGQLRELYGDRLDDPETVLQLTLSLGARGKAPFGGSGPPKG